MKSVIAIIIAGLGYLLLWPVPIEPQPWSPPTNQGFIGAYQANQKLAEVSTIALPAEGPEGLAVREDGRLFFTLLGGDIGYLDEDGNAKIWLNTGGRALGMQFANDGSLYVADAFQGLIRITADGEQELVLDQVDGTPIRYANSVDVSENGVVYLTDASQRHSAAEHGTYGASLLDINEHQLSGRVIRFDPSSGDAEVIMTGLSFANGITLSHDQQTLYINETGHYRIWRLPLVGKDAGQPTPFIDNLPGFPDNLSRAPDGSYWAGIISPRNDLLDAIAEAPWIRKLVQRLPAAVRPKAVRYSHLIRFDDNGRVIDSLQDPNGGYAYITGALVAGDRLYLASLHEPSLGYLPWPR